MIVLKKPEKFKPGIYKFRVLSAVEGVSKNLNPMFIVTMEVEKDGKAWTVTDYITLEYQDGKYLENFFTCCRKKGVLKKGFIETQDFMNLSGLVNLGTLVYQGKTRPKILNYLPQLNRKNNGNR